MPSTSLTSSSPPNTDIKATKEAKLRSNLEFDSGLSPSSDMDIDPNNAISADTSRSREFETVDVVGHTRSKANAVTPKPFEATVESKSSKSGPEPSPVRAVSEFTPLSEAVALPTHSQSATTIPIHPRYDPGLTTRVDSALHVLVLRLAKELESTKEKLKKYEEHGNKNVSCSQRVNRGVQANPTHHNETIDPTLVLQLVQKDNEIIQLRQELSNFRQMYESHKRKLEMDLSGLHSKLSAKENEINIVADRNRQLESQLAQVQNQNDRLATSCDILQNELTKCIHINNPPALTRMNTNVQFQSPANSPTTPTTPTTPNIIASQQLRVVRRPSQQFRRESTGAVSTTSTQSPGQGMYPLPPAALTSNNATVKPAGVQSRPAQFTEQHGYALIPRPPSHPRGPVQLDYQVQRMEAVEQQRFHSTDRNAPQSLPPSNRFSSTQQPLELQHELSAAAQHQKQLLNRQHAAQNQLIRQFEHMSRPSVSVSDPPPTSTPGTNPAPVLARNVAQVPPPTHGHVVRRQRESAITQGAVARGAAMQGPMVSTQTNTYPQQQPYPAYHPPQMHSQPQPPQAIRRPTHVRPISGYPTPPSGQSFQIPYSYIAPHGQAAVPPVYREVHRNTVPVVSHVTEMQQQPPPVYYPQPQMQLIPVQQSPQAVEAGSSLSRPPADSRRDVVDLTLDEEDTEPDRPKKRQRVEERREIENQNGIPAPVHPPVPLGEKLVNDVKVEGDKEVVVINGHRTAENRADVTIPESNMKVPSESQLPIVDGLDTLKPEDLETLTQAFADHAEEDPSLKCCWFCMLGHQDDPTEWPVTRLKNPTIEEIANHVKETHTPVWEAICRGEFSEGEQGHEQADQAKQ